MFLRSIPLAAVVALALAACSDQPTAPRHGPGSAPPQASETSTRTAIHRMFKASTNDHLYSQYESEGESQPTSNYYVEYYDYFYLESDSSSGHVPLYRCWRALSSSTGDHWLSTDSSCDGAYVIGPVGYIATSQLSGTVALYSQYNALLDDTFHTISLSEAQYADANYNYSTPVVIGYVYTSP